MTRVIDLIRSHEAYWDRDTIRVRRRSRMHAETRRRYELGVVRDATAILVAIWVIVVLWASVTP